MASHLFDLDGTVLEYHKNKWLPGAREYICQLIYEGHWVGFWTMRGPQDIGQEWSIPNTKAFLVEQGLGDLPIMFGVPWDRHIYDDQDCYAHKLDTDQGLEDYR